MRPISRYIEKSLFYIRTQGFSGLFREIYRRYFVDKNSYENYMKKEEPGVSELESQRAFAFSYNPTYSFVIPLFKTEPLYLRQLLDSFRDQTYGNFEVCLADSTPREEAKALEEICNEYKEGGMDINYIPLEKNLGISGNTNEAIKQAKNEFIVFCDHDDTIALNTLFECTKALNSDPEIDAIYSEQDFLSANGTVRSEPIWKPDMDIEFLRCGNYITHIFVTRKTLIDKIGMLRSEYDGSQDFDFILRVCEASKKVCHIPYVLYHWRLIPQSTAANPKSKMYAYDAGVKAVKAHLDRVGIAYEDVVYDMEVGRYYTTYKILGEPKVSVITGENPGDGFKEALNKQDYKNIEIINAKNPIEGAGMAEGDFLLFMDENIKFEKPDAIRELLGFVQREDVGACGPKIVYSDGFIKSCGCVLGVKGVVGDALIGMPDGFGGNLGRGISLRSVSALDRFCFMTKTSDFWEVGARLDMEELWAADYCLELSDMGKSCVFNPRAKGVLYTDRPEYEDIPKGARLFQNQWKTKLELGDPFYNTNLSLIRGNFTL